MNGNSLQKERIDRKPWFWALMLMLLLFVIRFAVGFDGLFGQDSYSYLDQARKLRAWMISGENPGKFFWPRNYPLLGAIWPFHGLGLWMQFLSILGAGLCLAGTLGFARLLGVNHYFQGLLALILIGLSPFFMRTNLSIMSDPLSIGFMMLGIWKAETGLKEGRSKKLLFGAFFIGMAVWMRYPLALLASPFLIVWCYQLLRKRAFLSVLGMGFLFLLPAIPEMLLLPKTQDLAFERAFEHSNLLQWSIPNWFRREFFQSEGHVSYRLPNILAISGAIWHLGYWGFGVLGIGFHFLGRKLIKWPFPLTYLLGPACYALLLLGINLQNNRFLLPLLPFVLIWLLLAWQWLLDRVQKQWKIGILIAFFLLNLGFAVIINKKIWDLSKMEAQIAVELPKRMSEGAKLYEFGMESMLDGREVPISHLSMYDSIRIAPQTGDFVLFNLEMNESIWADQWPMKNWNQFSKEFQVVEMREWKDGWKLYELQ